MNGPLRGAWPFLSLRGGRSLFCHCEERSDEAISSRHAMTQLSYMQLLSAASMLDTELPPWSDNSTSTSSPTKPKPFCTLESQTTWRNACGSIGADWDQNSSADMGYRG